jgi:hypothetical protein
MLITLVPILLAEVECVFAPDDSCVVNENVKMTAGVDGCRDDPVDRLKRHQVRDDRYISPPQPFDLLGRLR